jgi:hypothetical protein
MSKKQHTVSYKIDTVALKKQLGRSSDEQLNNLIVMAVNEFLFAPMSVPVNPNMMIFLADMKILIEDTQDGLLLS